MDIGNLRHAAKALFQVAIEAADPALALAQTLKAHQLSAKGRLYLIAVGKAAVPMLREALAHVAPGSDVCAVAVTNLENATEIPGAELFISGHPVPDENGSKASSYILKLLSQTSPDDRVIALISGGGSALLPAPKDGLTLADKASVNQLLLGAGLDITQMNHVRQQLSELKGGGLSRHAAPASVTAYILSDVVGDDLRVIASGPTVSPIGTAQTAAEILRKADLWDRVPDSVRTLLSRATQTTTAARQPVPNAQNTLICSNRLSLQAMKTAATGFRAEIVDDLLDGNVTEVAPRLVKIAQNAGDGPLALIFGGETTVNLHGTGLGGRNQELALRFALLAQDLPGTWVFLSGGTDGRDGPTKAAGGLVDAATIDRITASGADARALLDNNDSNAALSASNDLLMTGGTGTNVADVMVFLKA